MGYNKEAQARYKAKTRQYKVQYTPTGPDGIRLNRYLKETGQSAKLILRM